jgi:ATP-dependent DNA ligase
MAAKVIPRGDARLHEPKLDGYRFQIVKDGRQVKLYSRSGYEWTRRLPALAETLRGLPCHSAVLDACRVQEAHPISAACRGRCDLGPTSSRFSCSISCAAMRMI